MTATEPEGWMPDGEWKESGDVRLAVWVDPLGEAGDFRLRRHSERGVELSAFLPVLESFGLVVIEAVPHRVDPGPAGGRAAHLDDFGVRVARRDAGQSRFVPATDGGRLLDALHAAIRGDTDIDSLNRLVTAAALDWHQIKVLRAYRRYRHQTAGAWTDIQLDDALVFEPAASARLVSYFEAMFDPGILDRADVVATARAVFVDGLADVPSLVHDQILRGFLGLVDATLRTNYYLPAAVEAHPVNLVLKLDSMAIPDLASPRPARETFVHGPCVEAIHLRAGLIARGGIRWSDRPDDFRTEVLDLAEAQVKKNAIIVPTGAKGGFVCRQRVGAGHGQMEAEAPTSDDVRHAYSGFIRALLDVTDNVVDGEVRLPEGVVARDGDDPYLVVAADRGTATFSDLANAISAEYGYWLGDAFASGGSSGYDHKAMGITARGAWVAVRRHFHQLGIDVQQEPIRVVGVGDLSGDVFGNGMLQSGAIELVAAFDHRHVFIDPAADPARSYAERRRVAALARSSWADYDRGAISAGGGVWDRDAKRIPLDPAARAVLGLAGDTEVLSPPALIAAILAAPVDLLFFGGIGTFIKAPGESDTAVGDRSNDAMRITSDQVRARVIAEGGNLAITQNARIRFSRRGGRINTDFIDNAAGVATSDREVNLKILLAMAMTDGRIDAAGRDRLLAEVTEAVADAVLRQVAHSVAALDRAVPASARDIEAYIALLDGLVRRGRLDPVVESLPSAEEFASRRQAGAGLIRPELAVLLAYAKSDLVSAIEQSHFVSDPALQQCVDTYFPHEVRVRYSDLIGRHRLYTQLLATDLAGEVVDQMGIVWAHETAAELGRDVAEVAAAFWAAREVLDAGEAWMEVERLANDVHADAEAQLHRTVVGAVGYLARCYLTRHGSLDVAETIATDRPMAESLRVGAHPLAQADEIQVVLQAAGTPVGVARRFATNAALARIADVGRVSEQSGWPPEEVLVTARKFDHVTGLDHLEPGLRELAVTGRWATWQVQALGDDATRLRRHGVMAIVAGSPAGRPADAVAEWAATRSEGLATVRELLDAFDPSHPGDALLVAGLALRALSRLL